MSTIIRNKLTNKIEGFYDEDYVELPPGFYDGLYQVEPGTAALKLEWAKNNVRQKRNELLTESDWTQLADAPLNPGQIQQWRVYRQVLRDLPASVNAPDQAIDWPTQPA